jgi:threonine dehydrogenase-like Zn-dependent dehydrogenase
MGAIVNRGLTLRAGQCNVQKYMRPLMDRIAQGQIDPSFVVTHRMKLEDAPDAYRMFRDKKDECVKVVLSP